MVEVVTVVQPYQLAGTGSVPDVVTRDGKGNPVQWVTTYTSVIVTETLTRDPVTGYATGRSQTIIDRP